MKIIILYLTLSEETMPRMSEMILLVIWIIFPNLARNIGCEKIGDLYIKVVLEGRGVIARSKKLDKWTSSSYRQFRRWKGKIPMKHNMYSR